MDEIQPQGSATAAELKIDATLIAKLNLADFQNAVPLIRDLWLINETDQTHEQVDLVLTSDPPFLKSRRWRIDTLAAGSRYPIRDLDVNLDGGLLARLTEAETAVVSFTLHKVNADASYPALVQRDITLELLPRNQWAGISHLPDLVAAFVQPNDPAVDRLLKRTAEVLRQNDRNPALDGYAGGAKRAWELTSAIWGATAGMELDYALPPASFEQSGQKVRSPSQIESSGLGTCFDFALLFCAALEQAGLNPLLVLTEGHAFAGVWLQPEEFSTTVVDDVTALRKRLRLKELVLFETTLITQRPTAPFSYATERGAQQVDESQDAGFRLAVDIRRARLQRIKPLASAEAAVATASGSEEALSAPAVPKIEDAPDLPNSAPANAEDVGQFDPKDRLLRWQRKLLDLSLRNNLLNFKGGKKALKLEAPDPAALEDLLASGQLLKLRPRPDLMDGADPRNQAIYEARELENVRRAHALEALQKREVFVGVPETELDSRLTELFRGAGVAAVPISPRIERRPARFDHLAPAVHWRRPIAHAAVPCRQRSVRAWWPGGPARQPDPPAVGRPVRGHPDWWRDLSTSLWWIRASRPGRPVSVPYRPAGEASGDRVPAWGRKHLPQPRCGHPMPLAGHGCASRSGNRVRHAGG